MLTSRDEQSIFADNSYAKPFFLTYLNTATLMLAITPSLLKTTFTRYRDGTLRSSVKGVFSIRNLRSIWKAGINTTIDQENVEESEAFLNPDQTLPTTSSDVQAQSNGSTTHLAREEKPPSKYLGLGPTSRLALIFCILWFGANYFAMACLQFTTVASTTILTSTSSVWTLLIGALTQIEKFTWRKLCGVLGSIAGIILISHVDLSASPSSSPTNPSANRLFHLNTSFLSRRALDEFPDKTVGEIALGDALALVSAIIYGVYTITLKRTTMIASPLEINMPLFFTLVGLFNVILTFPLFPILHFTGIEVFSPPPTAHIWMILIVNSFTSFASDIMWAYAMVLTSPLVVTVGLSLTIPVSLVGEMIIQGRYEGWIYWVGAMIVVGSFIFVEREEVKEETEEEEQEDAAERRSLEHGAMSASLISFGEVGGEHSTSGDGRFDKTNMDRRSEERNLIDSDDDEDDARRDRLYRQANGSLDLDL
jgi:solute carrier family 35 protein F5